MVGGEREETARKTAVGQVDGRAIRALRVRKGWTLRDLADRSGVSERAIQDIENGITGQPRPHTVQWLGQALGAQLAQLWVPVSSAESRPEPLATVLARDAAGSVLSRWDAHLEHVRVGRDARNDVILSDSRVSLFHALLTLCPDHVEVRDLNSGNGTCVAGQPIHELRSVAFGEAIGIRPYVIEVHRRAPAAPSPTMPFPGQS